MIIKTVDELKKRIGKFVALSQYNRNFDDSSTLYEKEQIDDAFTKMMLKG